MDKLHLDQPVATSAADPHRRSSPDVPPAREPDAIDLERGYEATDVGLRVVVLSVLSLAISAAVFILIVKWFNDALVTYVQDEQKEEWTDTRQRVLPPDPRLQPSVGHPTLDRQDMDALRSEQQGTVNEEGKYEGGLANVGFEWDAKAGHPKVGPDLEGRVSQWLRSPGTTQPTTAPTPEGNAPSGAAPAAPSSTQPANPTTQPATQPAEAGTPPANEPAAKPAETPAKPAEDQPKPDQPKPDQPKPDEPKPAEGTPGGSGGEK